LLDALQNPALYNHPVLRFEVIETHISWVLLTGPYAYKIKKPVNFGFVDFSTIDKRRFFCEEEVRLNRRLAPAWYLDVVAITGAPDRPCLGGAGPALEYAVKMWQFPHEARLDRVLDRGELTPERLDTLITAVAEFHGRAAVAGPDTVFGTPDRIAVRIRENLDTLKERAMDPVDLSRLDRLTHESEAAHAALAEVFDSRKRDGFIRECHGDLHLANVAWVDDTPLIFDCIEFNEDLRWVDVLSEVAFLAMDLEHRGAGRLARRALNAYLEATGDYPGLRVFGYYHAYRSLVRAKVTCLTWAQQGHDDATRARLVHDYRSYLTLADGPPEPARPFVAITCGVSGSGKTTVAQAVVEELGAIRIRSDVERKRLFGLPAQARTDSGLDTGLYAPDVSARTYARLAEAADPVLDAQWPVVVDAAFLVSSQRAALRAVAQRRNVPFVILDVQAPTPVLRARVVERGRRGKDASDADLFVLNRQLATRDMFDDGERDHTLVIDTSRQLEPGRLAAMIQSRVKAR
jgi:hypothetical protein